MIDNGEGVAPMEPPMHDPGYGSDTSDTSGGSGDDDLHPETMFSSTTNCALGSLSTLMVVGVIIYFISQLESGNLDM